MNFKPLTTLDELKAAQAAGLRVEWCSPHSAGWIIPRERPEEYLREGYGQLRVEVRAQRYPDDAVKALVEALESIRQYGSDTLSGRLSSDGPDDREWQRAGVREMTRRARIALEGFADLEPKS